jgi:hypothetical protein
VVEGTLLVEAPTAVGDVKGKMLVLELNLMPRSKEVKLHFSAVFRKKEDLPLSQLFPFIH